MASLKEMSNKPLFYAIAYVGLSTVTLYSMYPSDPFAFAGLEDSVIYLILLLLTIPGQLFSWGIRFAGIESKTIEFALVFISQIINTLIWWKIMLFFMKKD